MINSDLKVVFTYKITQAKSLFRGKTDRKLSFFFAKVQQSPETQTSLNPKYPNPAELKALKFEVCMEQLLTLSSERGFQPQKGNQNRQKVTHSAGQHSWGHELGLALKCGVMS